MEKAEKYKRNGQELYKMGDYFDALTCLHKAVKTFRMDYLSEKLKATNEEVFEQIKECYLLSANCYLRIH